jgi:hypothetical protein
MQDDEPRRSWPDVLRGASTAVAHGLAMSTRNPNDLSGLERVVDVVAI